jgi:Family of unknown function (DUF6069)
VPETTTTTDKTSAQSARRRNRALTVVGAAVGGVAVWVVSVLCGVDMQVLQGGVLQSVGIGMVVAAGVVSCLLGWALLAGLERFTRRATTVWTVIAVLVTVLSLAGPISGATTTGTAISLALMHLVVGAIAIAGFRRTTR